MPAVILISIGLLLIAWAIWYQTQHKQAHTEFQSIIKDAELFQLIHKTNHFIDAKQLANTVGVEEKLAKRHLAYLAQYGVLKGLYDANMTYITAYQLAEEVPLEAIPKMDIERMSEDDIVQAILQYSSDYEVTLARLVVIFDITIYEAKQLRHRLVRAKKLHGMMKNFRYTYVVAPSLRASFQYHHKDNYLKEELNKIRSRTAKTNPRPSSDERIKLPDAEVLQYAIENDGRLTPTLLCLKSKISIEEAKYRLEELYEQGMFVMNVDESNYVLEYQLRDQSLLG